MKITITGVEGHHGFGLADFKVTQDIPENGMVVVDFVADKKGTFTFKCSVPCGSGHREMTGTIVVS